MATRCCWRVTTGARDERVAAGSHTPRSRSRRRRRRRRALARGADAGARGRRYATQGTCAGFPRVDLVVPSGWCLALVADASDGLLFPRRVLEIAPGRFWLVDMGSWEPRRGRLLQFDLPASRAAGPVAMTVIADKLDRPLGLALGPDGKVYVGEAGRIWRTKVALPIARETVLDHLPDDGAHPLKEIAFAPGGRHVRQRRLEQRRMPRWRERVADAVSRPGRRQAARVGVRSRARRPEPHGAVVQALRDRPAQLARARLGRGPGRAAARRELGRLPRRGRTAPRS